MGTFGVLNMQELVLFATFETIFMVLISTILGIILGLPLGVLLFITSKNNLSENIYIKTLVNIVINITRSIPYLILIVILIPVTRIIVGSSIGTAASMVPLSLAAIVLIARVVEEALRTLQKGLVEATLAMGATKLQLIYKTLLPEALPNIISGVTIVIINLIGFSAMAGAVGGGGLGDLAIRYGYQRYNIEIIIEVAIILIIMVQLIQSVSDYFVKKMRK
jgi:D-methionine transport system permease protein